MRRVRFLLSSILLRYAMLLAPICVLLINASPSAAQNRLLTLDTPNPAAYANFGSSVAVGDVNGDGEKEIVVGASGVGATGQANQGKVYVFSATDGALLFSLSSPDPELGGHFGLVALGDVNGDGTAEIVVGAMGENDYSGRTYVFSGTDHSLLMTLDNPRPQASAFFGESVAAGDVNGDGKADVLVGAEYENVGGNHWQGEAYLFSGADGSLLFTLDSPNAQANGEFGQSVAIGDVNDDGRGEMVVGAPSETADGVVYEGRAYVFSAADGSPIATFAHAGSYWIGDALAVGDVNGDGKGDVLVAAPGGGKPCVYVLSGGDFSSLYTFQAPGGIYSNRFGTALAVGDVNGDGKLDVAIGTQETVGGNAGQGRVYGFSGADGSLLFAIDTPDPSSWDGFSNAVALSDINSDGRADILVGAPEEPIGGNTSQGRVYAFSDPPVPTPIPPTPTPTPGLVGGIAEAPDVAAASTDSSAPPYAAFVGIAAVGIIGTAVGGWFAKRRRAG